MYIPYLSTVLLAGVIFPSLGAGVSLVLKPTTVSPGQASTATVTLSGPAPAGGAVISLAAEHPCCLLVPANITVQANQTSAQFTVGTKDLGQSYAGWVSASYNGGSQQATLSVQLPAALTIAAVALNPSTVAPGQSSTGTATLSGPAPAGGASIALGAQHPCCLLTAASVLVQAGQTAAQFTVTAKDIGQPYAGWVSASYGGLIKQATLSVARSTSAVASATSTILTGCTEIRTAGNYILTGDIADSLPGQNVPCLTIKSSGVNLDCQGHNFSDLDPTGGINLSIQSSGTVSVANCSFRLQPGSSKASAVSIVSASYLTMSNNVMGDTGLVYSDHLIFRGNTVLGSLTELATTDSVFDTNTITTRGDILVASAVHAQDGSNNRFIGNTINGSFDPLKYKGLNSTGADDGFVVADESRVTVSGNVISNVWDCGIETLGTITSATFQGNSIKTAALCGIGGWYWSSLRDSLIADNTVDSALMMFDFFHANGMRSTDSQIYFLNNTFRGNVFTNPRNFAYPGDVSTPAANFNFGSLSASIAAGDSRLAQPADLVMGGNTFTGNNFGTIVPAPSFVKHPSQPNQFAVDGGGNTCKAPASYIANYPLTCTQ